jgi:hypothetical protein
MGAIGIEEEEEDYKYIENSRSRLVFGRYSVQISDETPAILWFSSASSSKMQGEQLDSAKTASYQTLPSSSCVTLRLHTEIAV